MAYKCKNCGHPINVEGVFKDQHVAHINSGDGPCEVCIICGCDNPERKRKPLFCVNCKQEIRKYRGEWNHVDDYGVPPDSYVRFGGHERLPNKISHETKCWIPFPKEK